MPVCGDTCEAHACGCVCSPRRWGFWIHLPCFPGNLLQAGSWVGRRWGFQLFTAQQTDPQGDGLGQRGGEGLGGWGQESFFREVE